MKLKLKFLSKLIMLFLTLVSSVFSQTIDIPTGGVFKVRLNNPPAYSPNYMTITQSTGQVSILKSLNFESAIDPIYYGGIPLLHFYSDGFFIGRGAGNFTMTGFLNTGIGHTSLTSNTTGMGNTGLGYQSLMSNRSGNGNSAIGHQSLYSNETGSDNTAFGQNSLALNRTGGSNTGIGSASLLSNLGNKNTALGHNSGSNITTGSNNTAIGYDAQVPNSTLSNQVRIGNSAVTSICGEVGFTVCSDRRLKSNILNSNLGLNFVSKLRPVSYIRKNDVEQKTEYGFIAQEIEDVLKEYGVTHTGMIAIDDKGGYSVRYNDLFSPIVKAIQELKEENESLKKNNEELSAQIESMKTVDEKLVRLEKIVNELTSTKHTSTIEKK